MMVDMKVDHSPVWISLFVAAFGVVAHALTTFLTFTYPSRFLSPAEAQAYLDAWVQPLATIGTGLVFYVTPLVALIGGFYLVYVDGWPLRTVVRSFVAGSILFALGIVIVTWLVTTPRLRPGASGMAGQTGQMIALLGGPAVVAALLGHYLDGRTLSSPR